MKIKIIIIIINDIIKKFFIFKYLTYNLTYKFITYFFIKKLFITLVSFLNYNIISSDK